MIRFYMGVASILLAAFVTAACTSGAPKGWSAASWNGQPSSTIGMNGQNWLARPIEGQGFKLKFTTKIGGNFGTASAGPASDEALEAAAREAAPEGCTFVSIARTEDGGAVADYDCD